LHGAGENTERPALDEKMGSSTELRYRAAKLEPLVRTHPHPSLVSSRCWESIERTRVTRELRESERRRRLAQRAGRIGSFEWDFASGNVHWSPELEALYGAQPGAFSGNLDGWLQRCEPADASRIVTEIREVTARRQEFYDYEFRAILPDGRRRWFCGQGNSNTTRKAPWFACPV
jgi:PAS domain-containing protein